jgi:endonuclease/exonuclease/phosphatase (EEP) superfamily protein YafD
VSRFFNFHNRLFASTALLLITLAALSSAALATRFVLPEQTSVIRQLNTAPQPALHPGAINILVWNVYKGNRAGWSKTYQRLAKNKDLLFLQEVFLDQNMLDVLEQDLPRSYLMATSFIDQWYENVPSGVATASVSTPIDYDYLRSHSREPFAGTPKMGIYVEYDLINTDVNLLTANIHAINFVGAEKMKAMLDRVEEKLSSHDGPIILAGDFNTWTEKKKGYLHDMVQRLGLSEVHFEDDHRTKLFSHALDWVFVKDLDVVASRVHADSGSSDHNAIEAILSYNH